MGNHKTRLTSAEMSGLWTQYMTDSASTHVLPYFLAHMKDDAIRPVVEKSLQIAEGNLSFLATLFEGENFPIPVGFTQEDADTHTPRLFSDMFCLAYLKYMTVAQMTASTLAIGLSTRSDVVNFHDNTLMETVQLHETIKNVQLDKGIYIRPPYIPMPAETEFVTDQRFLGTVIGHQRPVTTAEIAHMYVNMETNIIGKDMMMAFAQVAENKKLRHYFTRGKNMANKHTKQLSKLFLENDLPAPMPWDVPITDSKVAPFSDKLMLFLVSAWSATGVSKYGLAMGASPRKDIGIKYGLLLAAVTLFAEDGENLMIDNGWLEEPPQAPDHTKHR
ncbi:DUF3231 family protein [Lentibacillus sp. CBA3610]|uniref:DUF3231 family protein n=1 Tax=Lentibacillus sp. CBA3610 TaxID=2518176 RepID=UPI00159600BC|nr:DUF3231 family protein [Lentibacillus sp. CBA3610]QKY68723.1 DUF3231 family protein [Lentibacillus sp. CBA3610]